MRIIKLVFVLFIVAGFFLVSCKKSPVNVVMRTSLGDIEIELYPDKAPETVENFLLYVDSNFYADTIFHRVIKGIVIQGGGFSKGLGLKGTMKPIYNESDNGLSNKRGTIAMARRKAPHSATSQFFINVRDNVKLDYKEKNGRAVRHGYCVFGKVRKGMDIVDAISIVETKKISKMHRNVPVTEVIIKSVKRVSEE